MVTARFDETRVEDGRYVVSMAPAYKGSCAVATYRTASGKTDVMVGMSGYEGNEPKTITLRKYRGSSIASMVRVKASDEGLKCILLGGMKLGSERTDLVLPDGTLLCAIFPVGKEREIEDETLVGGFSDVNDKVAHHEDIAWLSAQGISKGWDMPDGTVQFRPYANVARADMAAFLFRLAKSWGVVNDGWKPAGTASFNDVTAKTAHYTEIMWLAESGISQGWTVGKKKEFRPLANVARADMAAFLHRLAQKAGLEASTSGGAAFRDVTAKTAHSEDIAWLAATGVSKGWAVSGGYEFRPLANVARADMAAFLHRLDGLR